MEDLTLGIMNANDDSSGKHLKKPDEEENDILRADLEVDVEKITNVRVILSQVLAVCAINFILLDLGMILGFPTIVIADLLRSKEGLSISEEQASWLGSLAFIFQPLGSALSGLTFEPVGRKTTMLYVNIPLVAGWLLIHFGTEIIHLYVAQVIMGISIGLTDAPHITYLGEITQPKWRGILISFAELCVALGFCLVYFLGSFTNWRTVSAICSSIPIASILLISRIPESPIWLLSKGKREKSLKSLCWLRGWVDPDTVQDEFQDLRRHLDEIQFCEKDVTESGESSSNKNYLRRWTGKLNFSTLFRDIFRKSVLHPLFLVAIYFGFSHIAGVTNTRPFMLEILNEFGTTIAAINITAISSVVSMLGFVIGMILVPKTGKRLLSMMSMLGCALLDCSISLHGFLMTDMNIPWIPAVLFILLNFVWSCGIGQIPWMLISEVFPFRGRGIASGIVAAISYLEAFIFIKTYYSLYNSLTLSGAFAFYALCSLCGVFFIYKFIPETEGKTLQDIETLLRNQYSKISFKRKVKSKNLKLNHK